MLYLIGKNLPDQKLVRIGLNIIYGIGPSSAKAICDKYNLNDRVRFKDLNEKQKTFLAQELSNLKLESQLRKQKKDNIKKLIDIKSYRGLRHKLGLPVRGQRTHSNGRTFKRLSKGS
jgi:small subunit ribosomal protein S13